MNSKICVHRGKPGVSGFPKPKVETNVLVVSIETICTRGPKREWLGSPLSPSDVQTEEVPSAGR